eukprot:1299990-Rhodomonas_salina.3
MPCPVLPERLVLCYHISSTAAVYAATTLVVLMRRTVLQRALEHERIARAASERRQELTTYLDPRP